MFCAVLPFFFAPEEFLIHLLRQSAPVIVHDVRVDIGHHIGLRVTGVALNGLDVAAGNPQLQRCTAVMIP